MHAFGDASVFIVAFAAGSVVPTGLVLHFLRTCPRASAVYSGAGLAVAVTGLLAVASLHAPGLQATSGPVLAIPRVFVAPLFAAPFTLVGVSSPGRASRRGLYAAAAIECFTADLRPRALVAAVAAAGGPLMDDASRSARLSARPKDD